jgi:hypothetical protein
MMRRDFCKFWISVFSLAVVTSVAGCGGNDAPGASSPSSPPVDPNVAFKQYTDAAQPFECSSAYGDMGDAAQVGNFGVMKNNARVHRDVVATWDAQLGEIAFPAVAQPIVAKMHELLAAELSGLKELAEVDPGVGIESEAGDRIDVVRSQVEAADSSVTVEGDRLRAALGHPESEAGNASDELESADRAFYSDSAPMHAKWKAALAAGDLNMAKASNAIEEEAAQHYLDQLDTIAFPAGYEGQVNNLRNSLRWLVEFDRRQVDVATAAQIIPPEEGAKIMPAIADAKAALWVRLAREFQAALPQPRC